MSDPDRLAAIKRRLSAIPPNDIRDAIDRELFAEVDRLRGLLARLEWAGVHRWSYEENGCPICNADAELGRHEPGCELATALQKPNDPPQSPEG